MAPLTFWELCKALDLANVRVSKAPNEHLRGDTPRGALLDALNEILAKKEKGQTP